MNDDTKNVRRIQDTLKDRRKIPAKLLQFSENQRPAYYGKIRLPCVSPVWLIHRFIGTWTKPSAVVGPRTPFAKDVVALDYSYDSSDEWEGQEEAEGAEDLMAADGDSGDEEDEDEMSDSESDWIVGDDEVIEDGNSPQPEAIQADFSTIDADATPKKRRVKEKDGAVGSKKRKVLIGPLLPFMKGPCWESTIGECEYEPFLDMRIRLLNGPPGALCLHIRTDVPLAVVEAPFPLDPFTYVADTIRSADAPSTSAPLANNFAIPAIPPHISSKIPCPVTPAMMEAGDKDSQNETKPTTNKRPPLAFNFPADRMPDFLRVIDGSTKTKPGLIELLYDTFSAQVNNLRKSGIERKLPEVAVKQKKVWKVKDEAWVSRTSCVEGHEFTLA